MARLAELRLHPRTATWLLTAVATVMALCSTLCLALLMVVGTAQVPGNPLPDGWSDPEVRAAVPYDEIAGRAAIPALVLVVASCARTLWRHHRVARRARHALSGLPARSVVVLPETEPYAYGKRPSPGGTGARPLRHRSTGTSWRSGRVMRYGPLIFVRTGHRASKSPASAEAIRRCESASSSRPWRWSVRPSISRA